MPASVRVVVQLPWNRPENPLNDPPPIEWNAEKADILWKVIERSRSVDSGGADWKGLAAHLEVPLPYLLYRVNARFQEEIRGLKDIQGALSPSATHAAKPFGEQSMAERPSVAGRAASRMGGSTLSVTSRLTTPLGVRARLNSLGHNSQRPKKASSSSTLTVQGVKKPHVPLRPNSPLSSDEGTNSEDDEVIKEEEAERNAEEQEALDKKLEDLQKLMTNDALGLVSAPQDKVKPISRGRTGLPSASMTGSFRRDVYSSRSVSQSVSSASSPQGSIPDIPSPPVESQSQSHSPMSRHLSTRKSTSPPTVSPRSALGNAHRRYGPLVDRSMSEQESSQSEASSFSDISDASLSASALESALLSNIRGNGSRISQFARSRLIGRGTGIPH